MAIIAEEPEQEAEEESVFRNRKSSSTVNPRSTTATTTASTPMPPSSSTAPNPFVFWFYFTLAVSLIALFFTSLPSFSSQDPKSWFLSLPTSLRQHYSNGRMIKVQTSPNQPPLEIFAVENGPDVSENVVIVHGLGLSSFSFRKLSQYLGAKGVHVLSIDLPGHGFSDKSTLAVEDGPKGVLGRLLDVYSAIQEKGIFWAFDQIVETGEIPYEEIQKELSKRKVAKPVGMGPEEIGEMLGQVIESMGLSPVHLVLHDSALAMTSNWIAENSKLVRSITLIDTTPSGALPVWVFKIPIVRDVFLGFSFAYARLIELCPKWIDVVDVEAERVLLKGRGGGSAVVNMGKKLNQSFDVAEWSSLDYLKAIPMQVLWANSLSKEWSEEGRRLADALPKASFISYSDGLRPQEDAVDEIGGVIARFVSSLPASTRSVAEEAFPDHVQKIKLGGNNHQHIRDHDQLGSQVHGHEEDFMDAYGLGHHGW